MWAQFSDNFNDGNISSNPRWQGEVSEFIVDENGRLQLTSEAISGSKMLYTSSPIGDSARWDLDVFMDFNTSSANYCRLYLAAEDTVLDTTNCFFAQLGGSSDNIQLWIRNNGQETLILESESGLFDNDSTAMHLSIHYSNNKLSIDTGFSALQTIICTSVNLPTYNYRYFALQPVFTSTRSTKFWFDNIHVVGKTETVAPRVIAQKCIGPNALEITFTETISASSLLVQNFIVDDTLTPSSVASTNRSVVLTFPTNLPQKKYLSIVIQNLTDEFSNILTDTLVYTFCGTIDLAEFGDVLINEIMIDPSPNDNLPEEEFLELYNNSEKAVSLSSLNLFNNHNQYHFLTDTILLPQQYYTICASENVYAFTSIGISNVIGAVDFPSLNNTADSLSLVSNGLTIDIVNYNTEWHNTPKTNGGYSLERIDPTSVCNDPFNFTYSIANTQGTPSQKNSVYTVYDGEYHIVTMEALPNKSLVLNTSSALSLMDFENTTLKLNNEENIGIVQSHNSANTYTIYFNSWPNPGTVVEAHFQSLISCRGTTLDTVITVTIPTPSSGNELHITELMIDPSPPVGLPNAEYLEIYNSANYAVYLSDFELIDKSKTYHLPPFKIPPKEYALLISDSDSELFNDFNCMLLQNFPSLLNSEYSIGIKHINSGIIDEIHYTSEYYKDITKSDGGYSLENINPVENCLGKLNFSASNDPKGGTPGKQNSIHQTSSISTPLFVEKTSMNNEHLSIVFDRNINPSVNFDFNSLTFTPSVPYTVNYFNRDSLIVNVFLDNGVFEYQLHMKDIEDCLQNTLDTTLTLYFGKEPSKGDLIFTEIMADPTPNNELPEVEYLELYNTTAFPLRLNNIALNSIALNLDYVLPANAYALISSDGRSFGLHNSLTINALSHTFLTNSGKHLALYNTKNNEAITELNYSTTWHSNDFALDGGISLELNDLNLKCYNSPLFWSSSTHPHGGTPGKENSISEQEIFPAMPTLSYFNNKRLSFGFTRPMSLDSIDFSFTEIIDSVYLSGNAHLLHLKLKNDLSENLLTYSFHIKQCNNNLKVSSTLALKKPVSPKSNQLIINEILYDAKENQNEFIELYNPTSAFLSLNNLRYQLDSKSGVLDSLGLIMPPNSYVFLAADTNKLTGFNHKNSLAYYPFFELPTLTNTGVEFSIQSNNNDTLDHIRVDDKQHYPLLIDTKGVALERIFNPNLDSPQFASAPESYGFASPGLKNATSIVDNESNELIRLSDNYISANGDGYQDFVSITYSKAKVESIDITIYDRAGFIVRHIANNYIHSGESSFIWNGENNSKQLTEAGVYILVLDVSSDGKSTNRIRKTITVSR